MGKVPLHINSSDEVDCFYGLIPLLAKRSRPLPRRAERG